MKKYVGKVRKTIFDELYNGWLAEGPPVCFVEGFPA